MKCEVDLRKVIKKNGKGMDLKERLLFIDLDDFKHINDGLRPSVWGYTSSADCGRTYGNSRICVDNCYRMGGDEFVTNS